MAERVPERFIDDKVVRRPNLRLVPPLQRPDVTDRQASFERSSEDHVIMNVIIHVDGQPYEVSVDTTTGTLGNGQPLETFFERFEHRRENADGTVSGDIGRADTLAHHALYLAEKR